MIRAILIDDELHCIEALQNDLLRFCPQVTIAATGSSAKEGIIAIHEHKPDLVFLDIEMPVINGFEMLKMLERATMPHIIFSTAHEKFAIDALRISAIDYLLKPIDRNELTRAIDRVEQMINAQKDQKRHISNLLENEKTIIEQQKIAVPVRDGYDFITLSDILYCKADGAYTIIKLLNDKSLLLSKQLGELELSFPGNIFLRIHHSYLVNVQHIRQFKKTEGTYLIMNNGDTLSVSRSRKEDIMVRLGIK